MIKVALTGNIASGKSFAAEYIKKCGFKVFDADNCAHKIVQNNKDILKIFGTNDRQELSKIVFNDKQKLKVLEDIVHPVVKAELFEFFGRNEKEKIVFAEIPLLFEAGFDKIFDKVIFVSAPYDIRLKRLIERNGYDESFARLRLNSQMSEEEKNPRSNFVIVNDSAFNEFKQKIDEVIKSLKLL